MITRNSIHTCHYICWDISEWHWQKGWTIPMYTPVWHNPGLDDKTVSCVWDECSWCDQSHHKTEKECFTLQNPDGGLTDKHMTVVNTILQQDYQMANGLQDTKFYNKTSLGTSQQLSMFSFFFYNCCVAFLDAGNSLPASRKATQQIYQQCMCMIH